MAHKTKVRGTNYEITGGKVKRDGTNYSIACGKVKRDGTNYDISFFTGFYIEDERFLIDDGMTWYDWVDSSYFKIPTGYESMYIDDFDNVVVTSGDYVYHVFNQRGEPENANNEIQRGENYSIFKEE